MVVVFTGADARGNEIIRSDSTSIASGFAALGFAPFNPALGALDKVVISISGSLQFTLTIPPGGLVTPTVDIGADGLAGTGFAFAVAGAQILFPAQTNPIVDPLAPVPRSVGLSDVFSIDFTVDASSDLAGFATAGGLGNPAPLVPPTSVDANRSAFAKSIGVLENLIFTPDGFAPDAGIGGDVSILATYDFTPADQTTVAEPSALALFAPLLVLGCRRVAGPARTAKAGKRTRTVTVIPATAI